MSQIHQMDQVGHIDQMNQIERMNQIDQMKQMDRMREGTMNRTMVERLMAWMMIEVVRGIFGEAGGLKAGRCTRARMCPTILLVARLTVSNTGITMMESFAMEVWDKHVCQSIDPKQKNWGPGQRTVHALDQEVVQQVPVYNKEKFDPMNQMDRMREGTVNRTMVERLMAWMMI